MKIGCYLILIPKEENMENMFLIFGWNLIAVLCFMACGWPISLLKKNVTIVDSMWGLGFILIAWLTFFNSDGYLGRKILIALLTTIWGLRLSLHISWRNWGKGEDRRYTAWRIESGKNFWYVSLFKVFLLQAVVLWLISLVLQYGQISAVPAHLTRFDGLGVLIWLIGFIFEAIGDWQLARFKADPTHRGKVMNKGLWRYSRHPNYFGECLIWWGIFLITLATPYGFWTIVSPIIITVVLLKITGITITEKSILETKPGYRDYISKTSAFIPWFPKK